MHRDPVVSAATPDGPPDTSSVTVVICTHNRAAYLREALESVILQLDPQDEVLVIDNRSTDETREVVRSFEGSGHVRYLFEEMLGLCHARNAGWRNAAGAYVAYLDDDAVACPGWLAALRAAFRMLPAAGAVGGRVEPIWQGERPVWLSDEIAMSLTIVDWSESPKMISDVRNEWLVGANMAFPAAVLATIGGFEPRLDRIGSNMLSGGDVYLQEQIIGAGYPCFYYPAMAVRHRVPASRLSKKWFRRRYYWQGISDSVMYRLRHSRSTGRIWSQALRRAARLLAAPGRILELVVSSDDPARFTRKCFLMIELGYIAGLLDLVRRPS